MFKYLFCWLIFIYLNWNYNRLRFCKPKQEGYRNTLQHNIKYSTAYILTIFKDLLCLTQIFLFLFQYFLSERNVQIILFEFGPIFFLYQDKLMVFADLLILRKRRKVHIWLIVLSFRIKIRAFTIFIVNKPQLKSLDLIQLGIKFNFWLNFFIFPAKSEHMLYHLKCSMLFTQIAVDKYRKFTPNWELNTCKQMLFSLAIFIRRLQLEIKFVIWFFII